LLNHFPGGVYAPATLAAFSAMPLNSLDVQARTVSILDSEPLAASAISNGYRIRSISDLGNEHDVVLNLL